MVDTGPQALVLPATVTFIAVVVLLVIPDGTGIVLKVIVLLSPAANVPIDRVTIPEF